MRGGALTAKDWLRCETMANELKQQVGCQTDFGQMLCEVTCLYQLINRLTEPCEELFDRLTLQEVYRFFEGYYQSHLTAPLGKEW